MRIQKERENHVKATVRRKEMKFAKKDKVRKIEARKE